VVLLFLAVGLVATGYPIFQIVRFHLVQNYVPVPARILAVHQHSTRRHGRPEVSFTAEYEYTFANQVHRGENLNLWGRRTQDEEQVNALKEAKQTGKAITVWIDPKTPGVSFLDRSLDTSAIAFMTVFAVVLVTFTYWLLYLALGPGQPREPQVFYAFPFKRNLAGRAYWISYLCAFTWLITGYLAVEGSSAVVWVMALAGLAGWFLNNLLARRKFFAEVGLVEIRWLSPLVPGQTIGLELRMSRPGALAYLELDLVCDELPGAGAKTGRKARFHHSFKASDFRPSDGANTFTTTLALPPGVPPTSPTDRQKSDPSVSWTFTLKTPIAGPYRQRLSPTVG